MLTRQFTVTFASGLHARPATEFVRILKTFQSAVTVQKKETAANAKSLVKLLKLGIIQNDLLTFQFDGPDEADAAAATEAFFAKAESSS